MSFPRGSVVETVCRSLARCCHCNAPYVSSRRCAPLRGRPGTADSLSANVAVGHQLRAWLRCTNIRTTGGATTTPASTVAHAQAALRRSASANVAVGCQLRAWLRCTNIRTTAGATTTPATTVTQAALRRSASANLAGRAAASTLAQVRRLCGDSLTANLASERGQNALVRPCSCLKSGGLYLRM